MKLAILGATGPSGQQLVHLAVEEGHKVTAVVRNPDKIPETIKNHKNFHCVKADIFSVDSLKKAFEGCEAVLSCLGVAGVVRPFKTVTLYSESCKAIVEAMKSVEIHKLIVMSSWCSAYEAGNPKFVESVLKPLFIGRHTDDMRRMETYLESEKDHIDFVVVRPPGLDNTAMTEREIKAVDGQWVSNHEMGWRMSMSRADVARFMLSCITSDQWLKKCVAIAL